MRPDDQADELSYMLVGSPPTRSPGILRLTGHGRDLNWDIKAANGQTGAGSTLNGRPLGEFEAEFTLADDGSADGPTDFDQWEDFARLLWSTVNGPQPVALPVYHPDLARNLYTEIVLRHMGEMIYDRLGGAIVKVKLGEHSPPKPKPPAKAQAKPAQTYPTTDEGRRSPPDPNAAAKQELSNLLDEASRP